MAEIERAEEADQEGLAQTEITDIRKQAETRGVDGETVPRQADPPFLEKTSVAEPPDTCETEDYVPGESDFQEAPSIVRQQVFSSPTGYEILGELGRGAMGVVYRARQEGLKRLVALKMILSGSHAGPQELARFQTEAEAVAQLQHANIVQIYEVGEHDGVPYFSLEFVDGQSLEKKLGGEPLESAEAVRLLEIMARAIHHAHQQGIVHRDLKPANVLLTLGGVPKISDFGLAKRLEDDSGHTRTGAIVGTPSYMAPEQARGDGDKIGPLADVYALGAVLYKMLTARPPFTASNSVDTVMQVVNEEPVPPTRLQSKVPPDLETICLKCLEKDDSKRYGNAEELAEDLRRFKEGKPIQARPVSRPERLWRWGRRNPRLAISSAAATLLALALMIGGPVAAMMIYKQKHVAEAARAEAVENERQAGIAKTEALKAKGEAEQNEQKAIEARGIAATQGQLALNTLKTLIHEVQSQLEHRPQLQGMRQRLLKSALGGLDQVAARGVDARQRDATMAGAYRRMGDIYLELGQSEKSLTHYEVYRDILEELEGAGTLPDPYGNLSFCYSNLGEAARRAGNSSLAKEHFVHALKIRQEWADSNPADRSIPQERIAESLGKVGSVSLMMGGIDEAQEFYLKSLELRQQWVQSEPANPRAQQELAGAHSALGQVSLRLGKSDDAESHAQKAFDLIAELHAKQPQYRPHRWNLALFSKQLGTVHLMAGKAKLAIDDYSQALPILEELSEADPRNALLRKHVAETRYGLGTACQRLADPAAAQHYEEALRLRQQLVADDPTSAAEQTNLVLSLARCGKHQEAARIADGLRTSHSEDPHVLYYLATGYAVCASAVARDGGLDSGDQEAAQLLEGYAKLAVTTLRSAIAHGYQATAELNLDPDLDGIRQRPDFQELLETHEPVAVHEPAAS